MRGCLRKVWLIDGLEGDDYYGDRKKMHITEEMMEKARDAVAEALGDAYDCTRVWSAWGYGTMGPDDFALVADDDSRVAEIVEAVISALTSNAELTCTQQRETPVMRCGSSGMR